MLSIKNEPKRLNFYMLIIMAVSAVWRPRMRRRFVLLGVISGSITTIPPEGPDIRR